jgi:hypothetical protein
MQGINDYNFAIAGDLADPDRCTVEISERKRGSPLDKLVAELMIVANSTWGGLLAEKNIACLYRAQTQGKVRMTTSPLPHEGLGVPQYAWMTSPLRRYCDLVNQWQLIACLKGETPAFAQKSAELFGAMRDFELTYAAYADFQRLMERYWCLRWLQQNDIREIGATVRREQQVKLDHLPLLVARAVAAGRYWRPVSGSVWRSTPSTCWVPRCLPLSLRHREIPGEPSRRRKSSERGHAVMAAGGARQTAGCPGDGDFAGGARAADDPALQFSGCLEGDAREGARHRPGQCQVGDASRPIAQALAQASLDGGGNTDENRRIKTPLPPTPQQTTGTEIERMQRRMQRTGRGPAEDADRGQEAARRRRRAQMPPSSRRR